MSKTTIEWTHRPGTVPETLNPTTGCNKVNRGCKHCYAEIMHNRLMKMNPEKYSRPFLDGAFPYPAALEIPRTWKKPRTVFVDSMSDLFHSNIPFMFILKCIGVFRETPQHTYLILTKRPERAGEFQRWAWPTVNQGGWPPNVWLGTSCNDQKSAEEMIPYLLQLDCAVRFLSYEPATGPLYLQRIDGNKTTTDICMVNALTGRHTDMGRPCHETRKLDWVIAGGESGSKAVPAHPAWFRQVRDDCKAAGTPFFFKQWGNWQPVDALPHMNFPEFQRKNYFTWKASEMPAGWESRATPEQHMERKPTKSFNLLDGQLHQEWPA